MCPESVKETTQGSHSQELDEHEQHSCFCKKYGGVMLLLDGKGAKRFNCTYLFTSYFLFVRDFHNSCYTLKCLPVPEWHPHMLS